MTHEAVQQMLLDLAYGELAPREARAVEEHVAGCDACRVELGRIRATRRAMSALPLLEPERGDGVLLAAAREAARARHPRRGGLLPRWAWAGAIGALGAAAAVALSMRLEAFRPARHDDADALVGSAPPARRGEMQGSPREKKRDIVASASPAPGPSTRPAPLTREERSTAQAPGRGGQDRPAVSGIAAPRAAPPREPPTPPALAAAKEAAAPAARAPLAEPDVTGAPAAPPPALGPAAQASRAMRRADGRSIATEEAAADDPIARYDAAARAGALVRTVDANGLCPGERRREIDRDAGGRAVRLALAIADADGARDVEAFYGADGRLAALRTTRDGTRQVIRFAPQDLAPGRIPHGVPLQAADLDISPPRCP